MTSKVVLSNVQVLTAGTRMEQDQEKGKPVAVTVVTLLVKPEQAERVALASTEGRSSSRCATRSTRVRPRPLASGRPHCWVSGSRRLAARRRRPSARPDR
jgi:hypothetical protein